MKHKSTARLFSIAAALMLCMNAAGTAFSGSGFIRSIPAAAIAADTEPVTMCVLLEGGALPDLTTDALTDEEHADMIRSREDMQNDVFASILKLYPEACMRYRYTVLLNGFSCVMPESLADAVRALPGVQDVSVCSEIRQPPRNSVKSPHTIRKQTAPAKDRSSASWTASWIRHIRCSPHFRMMYRSS